MTQYDLAQHLIDARQRRQLVATLDPDHVPPDAATAFAIQQAVIAGMDDTTGAWKIGARSPGAAASGAPIGRSLTRPSPARFAYGSFFRVVIELEVAFRFGDFIEPRNQVYARDEALSHVTSVCPAIEIVDSRYGEWPEVPPLAQLADAQNNGALVVGTPKPYAGLAKHFDFVAPDLTLTLDGRSILPEATGNPVGDPRELLVWFVNHCAAMGITIEPDWTITTGSYVGAYRMEGPGVVHGGIEGLGEVEVELSAS